jgi:hypothetical protein
MGYARYVGRIWALAVALGIGAGLAATPWAASAEPRTVRATDNTIARQLAISRWLLQTPVGSGGLPPRRAVPPVHLEKHRRCAARGVASRPGSWNLVAETR